MNTLSPVAPLANTPTQYAQLATPYAVPHISIVSGTYNRLPLLQTMVASVRESVRGLTYEIIIVDGGSTDGTLDWCRAQTDITLIEQATLVGAVKAFNAGCAVARGVTVALLNDDITVDGPTLAAAYDHMTTHPDVGQVAFRNNVQGNSGRAALDHVAGYLYGQCCLTLRWLGDLAGWWGDGYHTYGGDTQLGTRVWEMGYKVVELGSVTDFVVDDAVRKHNSRSRLVDGPLYHARWRDRLPDFKQWTPVPPRQRNLFVLAKSRSLRTLRFKLVPQGAAPRMGLTEELAKFGEAKQVNISSNLRVHGGVEGLNRMVVEEVRKFDPDLIIFQIQGAGTITLETLTKLRHDYPDTVIVNFNGDVRIPVPQYCIEVGRLCDMSLVASPDLFHEYAAGGVTRVGFWAPTYEAEFAAVASARADKPRTCDVVWLGTHYPDTATGAHFPDKALRYAAVEILVNSGLNVQVYGAGWPGAFKPLGRTDEQHARNADLYTGAKLALTVSHFNDLYGYTSDRLYFIMATGCPMLVKRFPSMERQGLVDGETCIGWDTVEELREKAEYWCRAENDEAREAIGRAAWRESLRLHSQRQRVKELLNLLRTTGPAGILNSGAYIASAGVRTGHDGATKQGETKMKQRFSNVAPVTLITRANGSTGNGRGARGAHRTVIAKHARQDLAGATGMVKVRYVGHQSGMKPYTGAATGTTYYFGPGRPEGYVDERDLDSILGKWVNRQRTFEVVTEQVQAVASRDSGAVNIGDVPRSKSMSLVDLHEFDTAPEVTPDVFVLDASDGVSPQEASAAGEVLSQYAPVEVAPEDDAALLVEELKEVEAVAVVEAVETVEVVEVLPSKRGRKKKGEGAHG